MHGAKIATMYHRRNIRDSEANIRQKIRITELPSLLENLTSGVNKKTKRLVQSGKTMFIYSVSVAGMLQITQG